MLKAGDDGLSKVWKAQKVWDPFYKGGKIVFAQDEETIFCEYEGNLKITHVKDPSNPILLIDHPEEYETISTFALHPNHQEIVIATTKFTLRHWLWKEKVTTKNLRAHRMPILCMEYDPTDDHRLMVSAGRDKVLNFYDLTTFTHLKTVPIMEELEAVTFLPSSSNNKTTSGKKKSTSSSKDEDYVLLTAGAKGVIRILSCQKKSSDELTYKSLGQIPLSSLSDSSDGITISEEILNLRGLTHLFVLPTKQEIVSVSKDYNISFFSLEKLSKLITTKSTGSASNLSMHPERILIGSYGDILDFSLLASSCQPQDSKARFSVAVVTNSAQVRVIDQDQHCDILEGHHDIILAVDSSPDGKWLVTSSKDHTSRLWYHTTSSSGSYYWQCKAICTGHTEAVGAVTISQCAASYASRKVFLVSGAGDKVIKRYALPLHTYESSSSTGDALVKVMSSHSVRGHEKDINCLLASPNDSLIASASQDKTIRLWNSLDLSPIATLKGHKRGVWKVVFSPIDKVLLSCSGDRTIKLWSMVDYSILRSIEGHSASVLQAVYVAMGQQVLSCAADGLLRLHTLRSSECQQTMDDHTDRVWALTALPNSYNTTNLLIDNNNDDDKQKQSTSSSLSVTDQMITKFALSGGSDGKLILWKDVTIEEDEKRIVAMEEKIIIEQQLSNDMHNKAYHKALKAALKLNMTTKVLQIFTTILEDDSQDNVNRGSSNGNEGEEEGVVICRVFTRLDPFLSTFTLEEIEKVITYMKEWNTNARFSTISQVVLHGLLRILGSEALLKMDVFKEALPGLIAYTERHGQRLHRLSEASFLLELVAGNANMPPMEPLKIIPFSIFQKPIRLLPHSSGDEVEEEGNNMVVSSGDDDDEVVVEEEDDDEVVDIGNTTAEEEEEDEGEEVVVEDEEVEEEESKVQAVVKKRRKEEKSSSKIVAVEPEKKRKRKKAEEVEVVSDEVEEEVSEVVVPVVAAASSTRGSKKRAKKAF
eukprot:scaffold1190_cov187-Ochromonas_danica.AAC.20